MDLHDARPLSPVRWEIPPTGPMRVPVHVHADRALAEAMDDTVREQAAHVAALPGIVQAVHVLPDAHWGYGFPVGAVAAFDAARGGVVSAGGVGFDISCGVRCLLSGLERAQVAEARGALADALAMRIPAGVGSRGAVRLNEHEMHDMLVGGAQWAVASGWGGTADLDRIESRGRADHAKPGEVSTLARRRQREEMGTLGSGNHYLEVQAVDEIHDPAIAAAWGLRPGGVVVMIHCGSRGLGHQVATDFQQLMVEAAPSYGLRLADRDLACAPIGSDLGRGYLGAMRAATNCALANRQILTHLAREAFARVFAQAAGPMPLLYDVSHNTCQEEAHRVDGEEGHGDGASRILHVHRKGATRAWGPGHPGLPDALRATGQPVLVGGSMGTASYLLAGGRAAGTGEGAGDADVAFASACHGAGRAMSRHEALRRWHGREVVDALAARGIVVRSPSARGVAEEAPGAYKDVGAVAEAAERDGLARRVARLVPLVCVKG